MIKKILGEDYEIRIYVQPGQHKGHISILVNEDDKDKVKEFIDEL